MDESGRAQGGEVRVGTIAALLLNRALVPELEEHAASGTVHRVKAFFPGAHGGVVDAAEDGSAGGRRMIDGAGFGDDEPDAAFDALAVIFGEARLRNSAIAPLPLHARHHKAVGQSEAVDGEWSE